MAWATPRTWTTGEVVTAAMMNAHIRDNLLETSPAKVTTSGDLVYATGANALARLPKGANGQALILASGLPAWGTPLYGQIVKPSDESVTSSAALQDDNDFTFAIAASEVWAVRFRLNLATAPGGFKFAFTVPAAAAGYMGSLLVSGSGTTPAYSTTITTGLNAGALAAVHGIWIECVIINSTTAGTVHFQWAQNASNATATTVKSGSLMQYGKLA